MHTQSGSIDYAWLCSQIQPHDGVEHNTEWCMQDTCIYTRSLDLELITIDLNGEMQM